MSICDSTAAMAVNSSVSMIRAMPPCSSTMPARLRNTRMQPDEQHDAGRGAFSELPEDADAGVVEASFGMRKQPDGQHGQQHIDDEQHPPFDELVLGRGVPKHQYISSGQRQDAASRPRKHCHSKSQNAGESSLSTSWFMPRVNRRDT